MKKIRPLSIRFRAQFKIDLEHPPTLEDDLAALFRLRQHLSQFSPKLSEWFLGGNTKEEAFLYSAFDENGPTTALMAVLKEKIRQEKDMLPPMRSVGLWNGEEQVEGASMGLFFRQTKEPSQVDFGTRLRDFLTYPNVLSTTRKMTEIWQPLFVSVEPVFYDPVFKDRPGVGWMLYLPRVLTVQQVPEARALVPVLSQDESGKERQTGTIIVSVTDEPFSDQNPEHVKIANAIEIRLVDQDLLPRFADL
ncbi:immunity 52 family protein [Denitromonas iodatirespirans]|uniref:Immunity 52 family protein n=1 Tax=Denitromonas iodatirespirans TaxID=2795389 RepID=A0A944DBX5_DENI1|nr:immunity 52 family protein [Denitromonas iodatirespirans]MBT0962607.1 immunity 52 family protein [Denitromonas iodatirespirans]